MCHRKRERIMVDVCVRAIEISNLPSRNIKTHRYNNCASLLNRSFITLECQSQRGDKNSLLIYLRNLYVDSLFNKNGTAILTTVQKIFISIFFHIKVHRKRF